MSNPLAQITEMLDLKKNMRRVEEEIQPLLEKIAKEKHPDQDADTTLKAVFNEGTRNLLQKDATYKDKLDHMAADMGQENFAAIRTNPDFQRIFNAWLQDYGQRQFEKMLNHVVEWSGGKVTFEQVEFLFVTVRAAERLAEE
jgi:hypothetical protein